MKPTASILSLSILISLTSLLTAADSDWPQWRGPGRDGISPETGLLKQWPAQGPPLVWKATGIGAGYSGVAVVDGTIYTMGDSTDASFVYALHEATGKPLWAAKVGKPGRRSRQGPGPRCTPTVAGDVVVGLGQFGDLVCVEAATGKEKWRKSLTSDFGGEMTSGGWGYSRITPGRRRQSHLHPGRSPWRPARPQQNDRGGSWRTKDFTDKAAYSSIVPAEIGGKRQFIQLTQESVVGVAPRTVKCSGVLPGVGALRLSQRRSFTKTTST